jgi:hypothetical protein
MPAVNMELLFQTIKDAKAASISPEKPFFDKTWKLPDIERVK